MYDYFFRLLRVIDGDTIQVDIDLGCCVHIDTELRMLGINAPEIHSTSQSEKVAAYDAMKYLEALLSIGPLAVKTVRTSKKDARDKREVYGRLLGTIVNGASADVNAEMVKAGHAIAYDGKGKRPAWPWKQLD